MLVFLTESFSFHFFPPLSDRDFFLAKSTAYDTGDETGVDHGETSDQRSICSLTFCRDALRRRVFPRPMDLIRIEDSLQPDGSQIPHRGQ
jgi:hypothetical protein